ncbi:MAG TPA: YdcF family protein [Candidatus Saccharimonadales bacterium]|nr:YdcF family protein [Candidatus Saccharimonadales bacterium]
MMPVYDAAIVLGSKPDVTSWRFPSHVYASLDKAAELWHEGAVGFIVLSGKWALSFETHTIIVQPYRECDEMAAYLLQKQVPASALLLEGESKDTISNLYYIKKTILRPKHLRKLLLITADFRLARIQYLVQKIFDTDCDITFQAVPSLPDEVYPHEAQTFVRTKQFLAPMTAGDLAFLDDAFYDAEYYAFTDAK